MIKLDIALLCKKWYGSTWLQNYRANEETDGNQENDYWFLCFLLVHRWEDITRGDLGTASTFIHNMEPQKDSLGCWTKSDVLHRETSHKTGYPERVQTMVSSFSSFTFTHQEKTLHGYQPALRIEIPHMTGIRTWKQLDIQMCQTLKACGLWRSLSHISACHWR